MDYSARFSEFGINQMSSDGPKQLSAWFHPPTFHPTWLTPEVHDYIKDKFQAIVVLHNNNCEDLGIYTQLIL